MESRCLESVVVHEGRVFTLHRDRIVLPNGVETSLEVIRHPGAAAIVPVTAAGNVLLVRQFRYAIDTSIWEIPAGTMEPDESPITCARRELVEEIGVSAGRWHDMGKITPLPAYSDEVIHLFRADDLQPAEQNLDADEILEVHEFNFQETLEMIRMGGIRDAKTIAGLTLALSSTDG